MALDIDWLLDRRRLTRQLALWRVLAVLALVAALVIVARPKLPRTGTHIARLTVDGVISEDIKRERAVDALLTDSSVAGVIVAIDSPGGSAGAGEALYTDLARVAAKKPVVVVMGGLAASAGYEIAMPAARIFAREGTLTGSIGVFIETPEISQLLGKVGVTVTAIVSGPLKDQPSLTHPLSPEGREAVQDLVNDIYGQFVAKVASGRHLPEDAVRKIADGRAYTGRQALKLGLVDEIGGEPEARDWLAKEKGIARTTPVEEVEERSLTERTLGTYGSWLGETVVNSLMQHGFGIDRPLALWHVQ